MNSFTAERPRFIAFYLPQYHPIPENDAWWGRGFTEWTNVAKAKPLFSGHYQPHVPADLGFYDLRVPETRVAQADMAKDYGIEGFCYYHYWFGGKRLLQRPFDEVLDSGEPDFPFCICWANESWTGIWHGAEHRVLIEQTYPPHDIQPHFEYLLKAFRDKRYMLVDGKPMFLVYQPLALPDTKRYTDMWRDLAIKAGLKGLYLIGIHSPGNWIPDDSGFDACVNPKFPARRPKSVARRYMIKWLKNEYQRRTGQPSHYSYDKVIDTLFDYVDIAHSKFPCVVPNWDNTPRSGVNGLVLDGSTPEKFGNQVRRALELTKNLKHDKRLIFIKSWNEWAEGNHLEPDLKFGHAYLEIIRKELEIAGL